jgi:tripartite-type tricarboxylate transporter receptor subunit TctC
LGTDRENSSPKLIEGHIMKVPHRRQFLYLAAGAAALPAVSRMARAQTYPSRPITIVVPFPPGGANDTLGRILAERMRGSLNQPVIIENVGGASGSIGVGRVVRAAADGYTLSIGSTSSHVLTGAMYSLPYDLTKDLEPVALLATEPMMILSKKSLPATDLRELIAWLKVNPDKASLGNQGAGSIGHVAGVLFQRETGTRFAHVPYRGSGPAIQDLAGGQIDILIDTATNTLPQIRAGNIKAYAIAGKSRVAAAPEVPTVDEAGLPGFYASVWFGLWVPARTPQDIIARINAATVDALADAAVHQRIAVLGQQIVARDQQMPEALRAFQKAEIEKWWPIIKAANIKPE